MYDGFLARFNWQGVQLGMTALEGGASITVVPNPALAEITIEGMPRAALQLQLVDAMGRMVLRERINDTSQHLKVDMLSSGCHVILLRDEKGGLLDAIRFIKQ